jgi:hypothetical protein
LASNEVEILDSRATVEKLKRNAAGRALDRRHFLAALGMTGAAAGAGLMSGCTTSNTTLPATTAGSAETDILNFALNLKFLKATFYSYVTRGTDLPSSNTPNSGAITGAPGTLAFTGTNAQQTTDLLNEVYFDEKSHVSGLQSLLASSAVSRPAINLAAYAAITATNALSLARMFEDVAITTYAGLSPSLSSSNVTVLAQILGVDSFHAGALRLISIQNPTIAAYFQADSFDVAPFDAGSAAAAGPSSKGAFFATAGASSATTATPAGTAFQRTTSQVLSILYGSGGTPAPSGTSSGGFFPNGMNGSIKKV